MQSNNLIASLAKFVERDEDEISKLVSTMSYKDLVLISAALRDGIKEDVYKILHGYGI